MHFPMHDQDHVVIPWSNSAPERMTHSQTRAAKREAKASAPIKKRPVKRRAHPIS